jgi:hypothetical protein
MLSILNINLFIHLGLNIILGVLSIMVIGANNGAILFFILSSIVARSLITDLMPHSAIGWKRILHILIEEFSPAVFVLLILAFISKETVPWKGLLVAMLVLMFFSLFLKGMFSFLNNWCYLKVTQLLTGLMALLLLGGIFLLPSMFSLLNNYDSKNQVYLFFAQLNPLIVSCHLFGLDPFHKDQLYHYFGSSFLVPKLDGVNSLAMLGIFASIFWLMYFFWGKDKTEKN